MNKKLFFPARTAKAAAGLKVVAAEIVWGRLPLKRDSKTSAEGGSTVYLRRLLGKTPSYVIGGAIRLELQTREHEQ